MRGPPGRGGSKSLSTLRRARALSTEHIKDERDPDPLHPPASGELWRYVIGVPFESCRTSRGSMRWRGVIVGLATDAPAAHPRSGGAPTSVSVGQRVEGYWRGRSPAWPATVAKAASRGRTTCLAYDDGGREDGVALDLIRERRSPEAWRDAVKPGHVPVGAWVRRCGGGGISKSKPDATREEGVVIACHDSGAFDVRLDDGALLEKRTTEQWEPLLVLRYEEGHDQRVVSMDQLRFLRRASSTRRRSRRRRSMRPLFPRLISRRCCSTPGSAGSMRSGGRR